LSDESRGEASLEPGSPREQRLARARPKSGRESEARTRATPGEPCGISSASNRELRRRLVVREARRCCVAAVAYRSVAVSRARARLPSWSGRSSADSRVDLKPRAALGISERIRNDRARSLDADEDRPLAAVNLNFGFDWRGREREREREREEGMIRDRAHAGYAFSLAKCRVYFAVNGSRHLLTSTTLFKCDEPATCAIKLAARRLR